MYSRTTSALFSIIVCTCAFWNVTATITTASPSHATALSTENLPPDTPASTAEDTTFSPGLNSTSNSTFSNDSTTALHSTELPPTPVNSSEAGSTTTAPTTLHSSVPGTGHAGSTVVASTNLLSSAATSVTGHESSTINKSDNTVTVLPTRETSALQGNGTMTIPVEVNITFKSDNNGISMKYSETVLTSIFSTILVVVLLTILAFCFNKYRKRRSQYSHHPLHENVYEPEAYSPPDDTLVISGGLYDAPRIYNPNMTVLEEDDSQHDYTSFSGRPGQFRLEFLPGDKDMDPAYNGSLRRNV